MTTKTKIVKAGFDPAIPLEKIHQHPKNPRRNATASDELVASVKAQGLMQALVVAPHPDIAGEYVLIAGHRRRDALTRAGAKTAKAEIRDDLVTEVQQIESMLIENSARADLTPIEEAEAYEQLQLFNLKPADIAKAVGRSGSLVRGRLKLLTLGEESRTKIHDGQVTIDDALAVAELPKAVREELEGLLGTSEFRWNLARHKERQRAAEKFKANVKVATELGILPYADERVDPWQLQRDGAVLRLNNSVSDATISEVIVNHTECLRWCESADYVGTPHLVLVCADPDSHVDENASPTTSVDAERAEREAHWEAQRAEHAARLEAERVASTLRYETLAVADLATVLRMGLPLFMWSMESIETEHLDADLELDRPNDSYLIESPYWTELIERIDKASDADMLRYLVALFAGELAIRAQDGDENRLVARFFEGLRALGHQFSDVDVAQESAALGTPTDEAGDD